MQIRNARFIGLFIVILVGVIVIGIWAMRPSFDENGAPGPVPAEEDRHDRTMTARGGSVAGEVRIYKTGDAAGGTAVRIEGEGEDLLTETDEEGRFRSPVPSGTELTITIVATEPLAPVVLRGVHVEPGMTEDLGTLYLDQSFRVRGEVVDRNGDPVPGATVEVFRTTPEKAQPGFDFLSLLAELGEVRTPLEATQTGADGGFVLTSLSPGSYRIEAGADNMAIGVLPRRTVSPAMENSIIRIVLNPGSALAGTVKDPEGLPVEGAAVTVILGSFFGLGDPEMQQVQTMTTAKGEYSFTSLTPGDAMLMVRAEGYGLHVSGNVAVGGTKRHDVVIGGGAGIKGRVTDDNGNPIEGAEVVLAVETERNGGILGQARTDEDGRYEIGHLPARKLQMFGVKKDGYPPYPATANMFEPGETVGPLEDGKFLTKDVTLVAGTTLSGNVTNSATGRPIPGAEVSALSPSVMGLGKGSHVVTDAAGAYRLDGLGEGVHLVFAKAPGYHQAAMSEQMLQQAFAFNSDEDPAPDAPLVKIEGKPDQVTKDLVLQPGVTISGRVLSPTGDPVGGARVSVMPREGDSMAAFYQYFKLAPPPVFTDENGGFRITGAPSGDEMRLTAEAEGLVKSYSEPFRAMAGGAASEVTIRLRAGGTLAGTVVGSDGRPLSGASVRVIPAPEGEAEESWNAAWLLEQATAHAVADDGTFRIAGLVPGPAWARFDGPGHQRTIRTDLSLTEGGVSGGTLVRLEEGFVITGRVIDESGAPVPGAGITANREMGKGPTVPDVSYLEHRTGANGEFEIGQLAPGTYVLQVNAAGYASDMRSGIAAGTRNMDLVLVKGKAIEGTVYLPDGSPAPSLWVSAQSEEANGSHGSGMTDVEGRFRIENLRSGSYWVEPQQIGPTGRKNLRMVKLSGISAGTANLEIHLQPAFSISGEVVDEAGQPVAGAHVWAGPVTGNEHREGSNGWTQTGTDGTFSVGGLDQGRYLVSANHEDRTNAGKIYRMGGATGVRIMLDARTEPGTGPTRSGTREAEPIEVPQIEPK